VANLPGVWLLVLQITSIGSTGGWNSEFGFPWLELFLFFSQGLVGTQENPGRNFFQLRVWLLDWLTRAGKFERRKFQAEFLKKN